MKLCRLCANIVDEESSNDLFHKSHKFMLEQVKELTGMIIKNMARQKLPRYFCDDCQIDLPKAYEFRSKIIKTQNYFKSKEFKMKFESQNKQITTTNKSETNEINETKSFLNDCSDAVEDYNSTAAAAYVEMVIKDEKRDFSINTDDEIPTDLNITKVRKLKTHKKSLKIKNDLEVRNKTSQTTNASNSSKTSQKFDAIFFPLEKEDNVKINNKSEEEGEESDKDALEGFTGDESEDPDFHMEGLIAKKKKYVKKPSNNLTKKTEMPKDPRKNPLFCYLCSTTLKTLHAFKVHCRKLHKGDKIFKCDFCEEKFIRVKSLIRHSRIHQGGKLFECRYCDMSFNAPTTRIHHERAKHTKDWPFLCPICGKSFITTTRGKEHMTVHTKERPYKCELCKTAYLQRNNFKKHRRSELHKNNEKKLKENMNNVQNEMKVSEIKDELREK